MSAAEFGRWIQYFNRYGRCTPVRMYDAGAALIAWKVDNIMGGKTTVGDYLPFKPEEDKVASVDEVIKLFGGVKARG